MTLIKVLIVDDSQLTRVNLKTTLLKAPDQLLIVGEAEEGEEAIGKARDLQPDIILMDIGMPVMDGVRATQNIRRLFPEIKVIMLTSHESEEDVLEAFRSGASSYCLKETPPELLLHVVISTAQGSSWIDPKIAKVVLKSLQPRSLSPQVSDESSPYQPLTVRELDVLTLITEGLNNQEIADRLCISLNTVKTHLKSIFQKLEVEDRTGAALKALKDRIV